MRVLLVEDETLLVEALEQTLEAEGIEVVRVCTTGAECLEGVEETRPDMVLVDIGLPDMSGLELGGQIVERFPATKVVVLTGRDDPQSAREAFDLGLHGYLTKGAKMKQLLSSIIAVHDGQIVMPVREARALSAVNRQTDEDILLAQLTPREREVLALLMEGASSKEIAKRLTLRVNTARTHVQNVLTKLQVHSRLEATAYAAHAKANKSRDSD